MRRKRDREVRTSTLLVFQTPDQLTSRPPPSHNAQLNTDNLARDLGQDQDTNLTKTDEG